MAKLSTKNSYEPSLYSVPLGSIPDHILTLLQFNISALSINDLNSSIDLSRSNLSFELKFLV